MKWKNRLQAVLTQTEEPTFSKDSPETELRITAKNHPNQLSAVIRSNESRDFPENNEERAEIKADSFLAILNRLIDAGIVFDVSADDFLFSDPSQKLKLSDIEFLKLNESAILCYLQQSLLMKHLFSHSPDLIEDFTFEVREHQSLMTINSGTSYEAYCIAVREVTRNWFKRLINEEILGEKKILSSKVR